MTDNPVAKARVGVMRRDRRVGLTENLPDEWVDAVRDAKVPDEFAPLNADLK